MKEESHLYVLVLYGLTCTATCIVAALVKCAFSEEAKFRTEGSTARQVVKAAELTAYTSAWYAISVSLTLFNKWFYSYWRGGFDLPVTSTACHMVVKALIAQWLVSSRLSPYREEPYSISAQDAWITMAPIGLATAGDVVLSNVSFLYITVTLYTIIKSASLIWILVWGILLKLEVCSARLCITCTSISLGLCLASYGETRLSLLGAALVLMAGCLGGMR